MGTGSKIKSKEWYLERLEKGVSLDAMAKEIGLTSGSSIRVHLKQLGIYKYRAKPPYTEQERALLVKMASEGKSNLEISMAVGHTLHSVQKERERMGVRKKDGLSTKSFTGFCQNMGSHYLSRRWV